MSSRTDEISGEFYIHVLQPLTPSQCFSVRQFVFPEKHDLVYKEKKDIKRD